MPTRMWRHGIHGFLEVLRDRLPGSLEHMLAFTYIAYNMMALLFETVPSFEDTWVECLGDLGRYRMALEEQQPRDREAWAGVAREWYSKANDKSPTTGRLHHHLARPTTLAHLSLYIKGLTCIVLFQSAEGGISTLLKPILRATVPTSSKKEQVELCLAQLHATLFTQPSKPFGLIGSTLGTLKHCAAKSLVDHSSERGSTDGLWRLIETFVYLAAANISQIITFGTTNKEGNRESRIPISLISQGLDLIGLSMSRAASPVEAGVSHNVVVELLKDTTNILDEPLEIEKSRPIERSSIFDDDATDDHDRIYRDRSWTQNVLAFAKMILYFIYSCCLTRRGRNHWRRSISWSAVCDCLNQVIAHQPRVSSSESPWASFNAPGTDVRRPLPQDLVLRGQHLTPWYCPSSLFSHPNADFEGSQLETPSMDVIRTKRIVWLTLCLASVSTN